jgi:hypothetical protein
MILRKETRGGTKEIKNKKLVKKEKTNTVWKETYRPTQQRRKQSKKLN